jgi:hypothetical protein
MMLRDAVVPAKKRAPFRWDVFEQAQSDKERCGIIVDMLLTHNNSHPQVLPCLSCTLLLEAGLAFVAEAGATTRVHVSDMH